jgi:AAA-like domain
MRKFNTSGPNMPKEDYTLPRLGLIESGKNLVYKNRYFTIWAPRQTGKSTYFRLLADTLEKEDYKVCYVNFENYKDATMAAFLGEFCARIERHWGIDFSGYDLQEIFTAIGKMNAVKYVLIIDEVDGINPEIMGQFLHSIRNAYHSRSEHGLKSVILVGVSNILGVIKDNASPFNIADNLNIPYFTNEETAELLNQHERETGQLFDPSVKKKISDITANQPGLVNGFAAQLVDNQPNKPVLDYADYIVVENNYLKFALDKNVSNIINKGEKHRSFIETLLFTETKIPFQIYREVIKDLYVNGIITYDEQGYVTFLVPLYRKCLHAAFYPYINGESGRIGSTINIDDYFAADGSLHIDMVIEGYKKYALRRKFRYFREKNKRGRYVTKHISKPIQVLDVLT